MKKRTIISLITSGVLLLAIIGSGANNSQANKSNISTQNSSTPSATVKVHTEPKAKPICDGTTITTDCVVDGTNYSTYVYHPAVPEKSHAETTTTDQKKIIGYCTLCNDGTYSPSCATGRGACSWHGGVQEWNAPEYANTPVSTTKTVVDAPAQAAYYDKTTE